MIFYLSATGNSEWVARRLSEYFGEPMVSIAQALKGESGSSAAIKGKTEIRYTLSANERVFFVFPVHSWGPAALVRRFIQRLHLDGYVHQPVVTVCTCGDNCGNTDRLMARYLRRRGIQATACYSVAMPNTYILMKGFGTDSPELAESKLQAAPRRMEEIIRSIAQGNKNQGRWYERGTHPALKSGLVYPLFIRFAIRNCKFYATEKCISCGVCVKVCPTSNIRMVDGRPQWSKDCVQCTACIHHCPVRAIEYGNVSQGQGRYLHPDQRNPNRGKLAPDKNH